jgi:hypothetical protein
MRNHDDRDQCRPRTPVWYYIESNPAMSLMSRLTLQRLMAYTPPGSDPVTPAQGCKPSHSHRGMRMPPGTSSADSW